MYHYSTLVVSAEDKLLRYRREAQSYTALHSSQTSQSWLERSRCYLAACLRSLASRLEPQTLQRNTSSCSS